MKYKNLIKIFLFLFPSAIFCQSKDFNRIHIIALSEFSSTNNQTIYNWLYDFIPSFIAESCTNYPNIKVVERTDFAKVVQELKFSLTGLKEGNKEIGNLLVADYLVMGSYSIFQESLSIYLKLIKTDTAELISTYTGKGNINALPQFLSTASTSLLSKLIGKDTLIPKIASPSIKINFLRIIQQAKYFYNTLPYHELQPRRVQMEWDFEVLINDLEELSAIYTGNAELFYLIGQLYLQIEDYDTAEQYFTSTIGLENDSYLGTLGLADMNRFLNNTAKAVSLYTKVIEQNPNLPDAYYGLVKCYYQDSSYDKCFQYLLKLIEVKPELEAGRTLFNVFLNGQNTTNKSQNTLLEGLRLFKNKDYSNALTILENITSEYPDFYYLHYALGKIYLGSNQIKLAEEYLLRAKQLYPTYDKLLKELGMLYYTSKDYKKAKSYFSTYIALSMDGSDFSEIRKLIKECEKRV